MQHVAQSGWGGHHMSHLVSAATALGSVVPTAADLGPRLHVAPTAPHAAQVPDQLECVLCVAQSSEQLEWALHIVDSASLEGGVQFKLWTSSLPFIWSMGPNEFDTLTWNNLVCICLGDSLLEM